MRWARRFERCLSRQHGVSSVFEEITEPQTSPENVVQEVVQADNNTKTESNNYPEDIINLENVIDSEDIIKLEEVEEVRQTSNPELNTCPKPPSNLQLAIHMRQKVKNKLK
jgi:hypothetical protein